MPWLTPIEDPKPSRLGESPQLTIRVSSGAGSGRTRLSAFDAALRDAGVADFNLIRLSSVIPPGADVRRVERGQQLRGGYGDRLYCVYAVAYASTPLEQAWAGVAWARRGDGSGAGLFVEHEGSSAATVEHDLRHSLSDIAAGRAGDFSEEGLVLSSAECLDHPVCAVVMATYQARDWSDHAV